MEVVQIVAHRGASLTAPENTMAAFTRAMQLGAHAIEFDVQPTADGQLVVIHDVTLDRTTNGQGAVFGRTGQRPNTSTRGTGSRRNLPANAFRGSQTYWH